MNETGLNLILFGQHEPEVFQLARALKGTKPHSLTMVDESHSLRELLRRGDDETVLVVFVDESGLRDRRDEIETAQSEAYELSVPLVLAIGADVAANPAYGAWLDRLPAVIEPPVDTLAVERALTSAFNALRVSGESRRLSAELDAHIPEASNIGQQSHTPMGHQSHTPIGHQSHTPIGHQSHTPIGHQSHTPIDSPVIESEAGAGGFTLVETDSESLAGAADDEARSANREEFAAQPDDLGERDFGAGDTGFDEFDVDFDDDAWDDLDDEDLEIRTWSESDDYDGDSRLDLSGASAISHPGAESPKVAQAAVVTPPPAHSSQQMVVVHLPELAAGSSSHVPLLRVFYAHHLSKSTGRLVLDKGGVTRLLPFLDGEPGVSDIGLALSRAQQRMGVSLVWDPATYEFSEVPVSVDDFRPLGNVKAFLHNVIDKHLSVNQLAVQLAKQLGRYPIPTLTGMRDPVVRQLPGISTFINRCTGLQSLDRLVAASAADMETLLKAAYFSFVTDLVFYSRRPIELGSAAGVAITYEKASPHQTGSGPGVNPSKSAPPPRRQPIPSQAGVTVGSPTTETNVDLATRLQARLNRWAHLDPYQILEVPEGCGEEHLKDRYYELVRAHHPDAVGALDDRSRGLAERIFIMIQQAYGEVGRQERQTEGAESGIGGPSRHSQQGTEVLGARERITSTGESPISTSAQNGRHATPERQGAPDESSNPRISKPDSAERQDSSLGSSGFGSRTSGVHPVARAARLRRARSRRMSKVGGRATGEYARAEDPNAPAEYFFKSGVTLMKGGAYDKALVDFKKASERSPEEGKILAHVAYASYLVDKAAKVDALSSLKRLARVDDEGQAYALLFLGHVYRIEGDDDSAKRHYRMCVAVDNRNIEAKRQMRLYDIRASKKSDGGLFDRFFTKSNTKSKKKKVKKP